MSFGAPELKITYEIKIKIIGETKSFKTEIVIVSLLTTSYV